MQKRGFNATLTSPLGSMQSGNQHFAPANFTWLAGRIQVARRAFKWRRCRIWRLWDDFASDKSD